MAPPPVSPRPGFTQRVLDQVVRPKPSKARWAWPALAAAGVLLAFAAWQDGRAKVGALREALDLETARLIAARDSLQGFLSADRVLQTAIDRDGFRGGMVILADDKSHRWKVVVHGIPAAPLGQRYTFWFITADGMVRGAEVNCDIKNPAVLVLDMPPGARLVKGGALTIEPRSGNVNVPRGAELAHLVL